MDKIERAAAIVAANEALVNADAATMTKNQLFLVDGSTNAETKIGDVITFEAGAVLKNIPFTIEGKDVVGLGLVGWNETQDKAVKLTIGSLKRKYYNTETPAEGQFAEHEASTGTDLIVFDSVESSKVLKTGVTLTRLANVNGFEVAKWLPATATKKATPELTTKGGVKYVKTVPKKFTSFNVVNS